MDYLGVGIHEGVVVNAQTKINDKGTLELVLSKKTDDDPLAAFENDTLDDSSVKLLLFPPNLTDFEGNQKTGIQILKEIKEIQNKLKQILEVYLTSETIANYFNNKTSFKGITVTKDNLDALMKKEDVVKAVLKNIYESFLKALTENKLIENEQTFRIKLRRQSKTKHFPMIPPYGKWVESSVIPTEASKLSFDDYEISKGLNSGVAVDPDPVPSDEEASIVNELFNEAEEEVITTDNGEENKGINEISF